MGDWTQSYQYNDYGRLLQAASPAGTFQYATYNAFDLVGEIDVSGANIYDTKGYDSLGRASSWYILNSNAADQEDYYYDAGSQRTQ